MTQDVNQIYRNSALAGSVTADEDGGATAPTGDSFDDGPYPHAGLRVKVNVPTDSTDDTLAIIFWDCTTTAGTYAECGRITIGGTGIAAKGLYEGIISSPKRFHRVSIDVTGSSVNFGAVHVAAVTGGEGTGAALDR